MLFRPPLTDAAGCLDHVSQMGIVYNIGLGSTMRRGNVKGSQKQKKIAKGKKRGEGELDPLQDDQDFNVQDELDQQQQPNKVIKLQKYETPEQLRQRLAREALRKIQPHGHQQLQDDFFIVEGPREEAKLVEEYDERVAEQLKKDYLRKQNKLYEDCASSYAPEGFTEGEEYKGHTLCITGFEITSEHIYSCSKDKSIIKWDRETKKKEFISLGKDGNHHRSDILSISLHSNENVLATAGDDCMVKLWDTRSLQLIDTLRGHKNTINGVKFGINSNNLCSISSDLTLKQWDFSQRGLIETFYQHTAEVLDIDCFNGNDFVTSGFDRQVIAWKTEKQTKIVFKGHDYAIDRVRAINLQRFVTASQDGSINLWHTRKSKPVFKLPGAHKSGWISAMDNIKQSNIFATAGIDHAVKLWAIESDAKGDPKGIHPLREVQVKGIVTDIKLRQDLLAVTECDQLRLGRWVTQKCRNKLKIFRVRSG